MRFRIHYAFVMVFLGMFSLIGSLGFGRFSYALLLPSMQREFNTSYTGMGSIATANALAYTLSALTCGYLATRFGPRIIISVSLVFCAVGLLVTGIAGGVVGAALGQFICGFGTGGAVGPVYTIVTPWFTPRRRGLATGIVQMGSGVGLVVGGALVPWLISLGQEMGWRFTWFILSILVLLAAVMAALFFRNSPAEKGLVPWGESGGHAKIPQPSPFKDVRAVYMSPRLWHLGVIFACFGLSYVVFTIFFAAYLISNGLSNQEAGFVWGLAGMLSIMGSLLWGSVADRFGRQLAMLLVQLIQGGALLLLSLSDSRPGLYLGALAYGLVLWGIPIVITLATTDLVGVRFAGAGVGLVIVMFSIGQVLGPLLAGWLKDTSGSLELPLIIAACIAWTGALLSLGIRKPANPPA